MKYARVQGDVMEESVRDCKGCRYCIARSKDKVWCEKSINTLLVNEEPFFCEKFEELA